MLLALSCSREFLMQLLGCCAIRGVRALWIVEAAETKSLVVYRYTGSPFGALFFPVNAFETTGVGTEFRSVALVLGVRSETQIRAPVVKAVHVHVVNLVTV
jgi:hypothetical protein